MAQLLISRIPVLTAYISGGLSGLGSVMQYIQYGTWIPVKHEMRPKWPKCRGLEFQCFRMAAPGKRGVELIAWSTWYDCILCVMKEHQQRVLCRGQTRKAQYCREAEQKGPPRNTWSRNGWRREDCVKCGLVGHQQCAWEQKTSSLPKKWSL